MAEGSETELRSLAKVIQLASAVPLWAEGKFGDMVNVWNQEEWANDTEVSVDQYSVDTGNSPQGTATLRGRYKCGKIRVFSKSQWENPFFPHKEEYQFNGQLVKKTVIVETIIRLSWESILK